MPTEEDQNLSARWKKCLEDCVGETIDCVVIGGYMSTFEAKRDDEYNEFLVACYDDNNKEFQTICKVAAGFDPNVLTFLTKSFKNKRINSPQPDYRFDPIHEPDQWFKAGRVFQIEVEDLSLSSEYKAALGLLDQGKGICVHLPRFIWSYPYEKKKPKEGTTASEVAEMYHKFQCRAISESDEEDVDLI